MAALQTGFAFPLVCYILVGVIFLLYDCVTIYKDNSKNGDNLCPSKVQCLKLVIKLSTILGGACYFVGDNIQTIGDTGNLPLILSVSAVLSYRILPLALRKVISYCKDGENTNKSFNLCSPNGSETHTLVVAYVYLLTMFIDFDIVLTVVLKKVDDNISLCNRTTELNTLWGFYGSLVGIFVVIELVIFAIFIVTELRNRDYCHSLPNFKLTLSSHGRSCPLVLCNFFLFVAVTAAVVLFLLADNRHLLECSTCTSKFLDCSTCIPNHLDCSKCTSKPLESTLRVLFLSFSFLVCSVVIFGFFFRMCFCCVQVKGNFTSVNVQENGRLRVNFQNKVWNYQRCSFVTENEEQSFTYDITNSSITPNLNHAELYKKDIKHVVKCAEYFSQVKTKLNAANARVAVVHKTKEEPYLLVYSTVNPITTNVYKVRTLPVPNGWVRAEEEPIICYGENNQYSIYLYHHEQNENQKRYYQVQEEVPAASEEASDIPLEEVLAASEEDSDKGISGTEEESFFPK